MRTWLHLCIALLFTGPAIAQEDPEVPPAEPAEPPPPEKEPEPPPPAPEPVPVTEAPAEPQGNDKACGDGEVCCATKDDGMDGKLSYACVAPDACTMPNQQIIKDAGLCKK